MDTNTNTSSGILYRISQIPKILGGRFQDSSDYQLKTRKPVVSTEFIGKFSGPKLEILDSSGLLVKTLQVKANHDTWTKGDKVMQIIQHDLVLETPNRADLQNPTSFEVVIETFASSDYTKALRAFDHAADEILSNTFHTSEKHSVNHAYRATDQAPAQAPKKSLLRRTISASLPWFGGAFLVLAFSLFWSGRSVSESASASSASPTESPAGSAPPEAWAQLTDQQRETMLKLASQAAAAVQGVDPQAAAAKNLDRLSADQMKKIAGSAVIKVGSGKKVFYAFEDPFCTACKHLSTQTQLLDPSFGLVVIPVAFQTGARERAAAALCSSNPAQDWKVAMSGFQSDAKACEEGYKKIDKNNELFMALGMSSTPTLVGKKGALVQGSGTTEQIAEWVQKDL